MGAPLLLRHAGLLAGLVLLSAATVRGMIALDVTDHPDERKAHVHPTPKAGGVGIVAAFLAGVAVLYEEPGHFARLANPYYHGLILAAAAIALVAFLDDLRDWPFTVKLAAQILAALAAVGSGLYVRVYDLPFWGPVDFGAWGGPLTLFWILFATNAMNFIDGLDGLAGGVALIASLFLAAIAARRGGWFVYFAALLLGAGIAGFLPFNFPRARIFMGDVGSQFCGFVLAILGVAAARFDGIPLSFLLVPMLLSGVLFDVGFTLAWRGLAGENLTRPHRSHLFQLAHRSGMDPRAISLLYWGFTVFGGLAALAFLAAPAEAKPFLALLPAVPQLLWVRHVLGRARRAGIWPERGAGKSPARPGSF